MIQPYLTIVDTPKMGRGVFSSEKIMAGTIIEISPVIVMNAEERLLLDQTSLHDYIFECGAELNQCCLALGDVSFYNHSSLSNCEYEMDYATASITIKAMRDIPAGEELFINYNGNWNDPSPVWFDLIY